MASSHYHPLPSFGNARQKKDRVAKNPTTPQEADIANGKDDSSADAGEEAQETADEADAAAPLVASYKKTQLAGKKSTRPSGARLDDNREQLSDAVEKKMSELEASGWRPEEEEVEAGAEDDDYNDVDLLSDSDDHETSMREQETRLFSAGSMGNDEEEMLARRLSLSSTENDMGLIDAFEFQGFADNEPSLMDFMADSFFSDSNNRDTTPVPSKAVQESNAQRRVRFEDELEDLDGSDAGSTDTEVVADAYPDLFMQADALGPTFQQMVDDDKYLDDGSDAGSCWDFEGDDMHIDLEVGNADDSSASSGSSSGYESDDGDTTDEEAPPPPSSVRRPAIERPSTASSMSSSGETPTVALIKGSNKRRRADSNRTTSPRLPTAGTFMLDPHRPVLLVNGAGRSQRNTFYPAKIQSPADKRFWQRLQSHLMGRNMSPRTSVQLTPDEDSDLGGFNSQSFDMDSPDAFFSTFGTLRADQVVGPPEAFMPFTNIDAGGAVTEDASVQSYSDDGGQDYLDLLNLDSDEDDDKDEDEEMPDDSDAPGSPWTTASTTFPTLSSKSLSRKNSGCDDLLAHLDRNRGLVGSFRRNQHLAKHVGSLASHPSLRASTSEMNAMQTGRRAAANTPITPLRKKKIGKDVGLRDSPITSPTSKTGTRKKGPVRGGFTGRR